jgi:hypothetical protein
LHPLPRWLELGCYREDRGWAEGGIANADPLCRSPSAVLGVEAADGPNGGTESGFVGHAADAMDDGEDDEAKDGEAGGVSNSRRLARFGRGAFGRATATCAVRGLADVAIGVHSGADSGGVAVAGALGGSTMGIGAGANTACGGIGGGICGVGVASGSGLGLALPGTCHVGYGDGTELRTTADWTQVLERGALFALGEGGCGGTFRVAHDRPYTGGSVPLAPADATFCALASRRAVRQVQQGVDGGAIDWAARYSGVELSGVIAFRAAPAPQAADVGRSRDQESAVPVASLAAAAAVVSVAGGAPGKSSADVEPLLGPRRAPAFAAPASDEAVGLAQLQAAGFAAHRTVGGHDPAALVDLYMRAGAVEAAARLAAELIDARGLVRAAAACSSACLLPSPAACCSFASIVCLTPPPPPCPPPPPPSPVRCSTIGATSAAAASTRTNSPTNCATPPSTAAWAWTLTRTIPCACITTQRPTARRSARYVPPLPPLPPPPPTPLPQFHRIEAVAASDDQHP